MSDNNASARSRLLRVVAAFAALYVVWGSTFLGIRIAIDSIPPMLMAGVRWLASGAFLYAALRSRGAAPATKRDWKIGAIVGFGIVFSGNGSVTYAEQYIPSGTAAVIVALVPALMALIGWLSGTSPRPRLPVWIGIALATVGVAVIVRPANEARGSNEAIGAAVLVFGAIVWSAASLYAARVRQHQSPFVMAAVQMMWGGGFLLGAAAIRGEFGAFSPAAVRLHSVVALMYLALVGSIVGFCAYLWLLRNVDATRVATYAYVNPVVAVLLGWLLAGEKLAPELLTGSALVVAGVGLIVTFRAKPQVARAPLAAARPA